ncbi:outer membrane lipoprotein LolB [Pandoraea sputorum]|uniref:Outer-membrane lipoprotein LolB n=2 Tax=Pandoraea sputorum TaxID=93222 RepID=A0A239S869_9BURK|nr:lipoprotein insertase outer membrane protein LolB [Pandoraea sputorum]SNU81626.1 Outer-membrane lipoprotein lolB precursor [Pandoraea sputorum]VVD65125.1 outer membrane lipoprotein LolB [Pandoraea sputorum]VVE81352.1 outer membrane lipoprotein LolB [Pandoraea sputorum]
MTLMTLARMVEKSQCASHPVIRRVDASRFVRAAALVVACTASVIATGCASLAPPAPVEPTAGATVEHYRGRFSVRYEQNGEARNTYGNFDWQQNGENATVQLLDPLGQTQAIVRESPRSASLELPGKAPITGPRLEDVMHDALGFALPVGGLRYWLRMQGAPGSQASIERDPQTQRPIHLKQDGWTIDYQAYFDGTPLRVKRVDLSRDLDNSPLAVRLVIDE